MCPKIVITEPVVESWYNFDFQMNSFNMHHYKIQFIAKGLSTDLLFIEQKKIAWHLTKM